MVFTDKFLFQTPAMNSYKWIHCITIKGMDINSDYIKQGDDIPSSSSVSRNIHFINREGFYIYYTLAVALEYFSK